jgi:opine dehydrogenase
MTARQWLYFAYEATGRGLHEAMHANPGYRNILAPATLHMRYLLEDVPASLVPMASLGAMLGVATPAMDAVIDLADALLGLDFRAEGRTVERLGIQGLSVRELRLLAIGEEEKR